MLNKINKQKTNKTKNKQKKKGIQKGRGNN